MAVDEAGEQKMPGRQMKWYCPGPGDYTGAIVDPPSPHWGAGWVHAHGATGLQSNFMLNILGGRMDVDGIDYTQVAPGVNTNIYLTSPHNIYGDASCDSGGKQPPCYEMDLMEAAGSVGYCTSWHFKYEGGGEMQTGRAHSGILGFKYEVSPGGCSTLHQVAVNPSGPTLPSSFTTQYSPIGIGDACGVTARVVSSRGVMVHSSQWSGWNCHGMHGVPGGPPEGNCAASVFKIRGVRLYGSHVQGKEPRTCWQKAQDMHMQQAAEAQKKRAAELKREKAAEAAEKVKEGGGEGVRGGGGGEEDRHAGGGPRPPPGPKEAADACCGEKGVAKALASGAQPAGVKDPSKEHIPGTPPATAPPPI
eukprot:g19083.t1